MFKEWTHVDTKKKKKKIKLGNLPTPVVEGITDGMDPLKLSGLVNQDDYAARKKSKKSKKRQRAVIEDLVSTLSSAMTTTPVSLKTEEPADKDEWRGVQSSSKAIKKDKNDRKEKEKSKKKKKRDADDDPQESCHANKFLKDTELGACEAVPDPSNQRTEELTLKSASKSDKKSKKRKRVEMAPEISDDDADDIDMNHGNLAQQIKSQLNEQPGKKYKVVVENMTKFQSKHLAKAGIEFVERKNKDPAKAKKELIDFDRISRKMRTSLSLEDDEEPWTEVRRPKHWSNIKSTIHIFLFIFYCK